MSAFEVSLTPTRVKKSHRNENREPVPVILAPFSAKSIVVFEDVPVSKTARRVLVVTNPSDVDIEVSLARKFRAELNIAVEWEATRIPAQGSVTMELVWNPLKIIASSESIQFIDNRNFRKDVSVVLKSFVKLAGSKNTMRYPNISCGTSKPAPKMFKSATSHAITAPVVKTKPLGNISKSEMNIAKMSCQNEMKRSTNDYQEKIEMDSPKTPRVDKEKENVSPETPKNASDLFDKFKFTPCTETKTKQTSNLEILSSMPTPVLGKKSEQRFVREEASNPRRIVEGPTEQVERSHRQTTPKKSPRWVPKIVKHSCTPPSAEKAVGGHPPNKFEPHIVSTASKRVAQEKMLAELSPNSTEQKRKLFPPNSRPVAINKTFELNNESLGSADSAEGLCEEAIVVEPVMNRTTTIVTNPPRLLSIIDEEERPDGGKLEGDDKSFYLQKTYAVPDENLLRDVQLIGTPLRKVSESLQDLSSRKLKMRTQGSMPNLTEMESLHSIEHNRYYLPVKIEADDSSDALDISSTSTKSTTVSAHELLFDQHEILAQSSRFNINEAGRRIKKIISPSESVKSSASSTSPGELSSSKRPREHSVDSPTNDDFLSIPTYTPGTCLMAVSPPKKSRMDPNERPGTKIRVKKWSATQPKKSVRSNMAPLRKPVTPRKIKIEPGVRLYDTDMYLQSYINPDPFAATITFDPFLASTMYLDEQTTRRHEQQLMKWLNALVALPADLDADCNRKVDVGNLFNVVRNQELILAPTKEEQSMNYLTKSRMEALRKAAVTLYMSHEMVEVCSKVAVHINKNSIELRKDRDLHLDVVLQRYILELLLSFNPLWLRLGLEVVFGEIIHLHSNSDIVGLSTFILNRLFRDRFIEDRHSKAYHLSQQYSAHMKKFTLQKFLLLILFLDKAKSKKIIKHNPCLFLPNSKYKETKEILLRFSSELISNMGDITRNLRRLGYFLVHKQSFIDEFNYAFKNLAVDLRDGVRLTRVMEIILLRDDLTLQLRAPAISRTQKAFNVNLALKALADANFTLTGGICAYDIVDGHREKTLSLLWQIIYKFRSPKFHAAATTIQRWWRNSWLGVVIKRRIRVKIEILRNEAARTIQAAYRGFAARKSTAIWKRERVTAVTSLQKFVRGFLCRRKLRIAINSIYLVQRWFRATRLAKIERTRYVHKKTATIRIQQWYRRVTIARKLYSAAFIIKDIKQQAKIEYENAILIQRAWKSFIIRKRLKIIVHQVLHRIRSQKVEYRSAARIQSFFQMIILRKHYLKTKQSSITIQRTWRLYKLTQSVRLEFIRQKTAAVIIQKYFKGYLAMKRQRHNFQTIRQSAIKIQRRYRETNQARKQRNQFLKLRTNAIAVQRQFRANLLMKLERDNYQKLKIATTIIQQRFRAQILMKYYRKLYLIKKNSVVKIQLKLRATFLARRVRFEFLSLQFHAILIQQRFRANRLMKQERRDFEMLRAASVTMQQHYRAQLMMRVERKRFIVLRIAASVFQTRFRAQMAMKMQRKEYLRLKSSVVVVQQRFRAILAMRKQRSEYRRIKQAVVKIQHYYRAILLMRMQRTSFVALKRAATILQGQYRAQQAMKKYKSEYNQLKNATINVQQRYRALQLMRVERRSYNRLKNAAINVQTRYRALKLMQKERSFFTNLKSAAIIIQKRFRANQEMREKRAQYLTTRKAAVIIQRRYRAQKAMQEASKKFTTIKSKVILIQKFVRSCHLTKRIRQEFLTQRSACLAIQNWWRRNLLMRKERTSYLQKLHAVVVIQTRWRAYLEMYNVRIEYLHTIRCVLQIQRYYKSYRLAKQIRVDFLNKKQAAITIQQGYRAQKQMIKNRNEFLEQKLAAIKIQQWFRSTYLMKLERKKFMTLRQATILIQQTYRARKLARNQHVKYLQIRNVTIHLQSYARGMLARKRFNEMLTPERREEIRRRKAVKIIQKYWRGYAIRKRWHSVEFQLMRNRIRLARANFKPANAIRNLVVASVQRLKERYLVAELLSILIRLENLSRVVPHTLKEQAAFIASFSYGIMAQANRSEPDKQVIELCSRIILNFARFPGTKEDVFQEPGLVTIAQMLLRWSDKDCPIFNTLCTLVWVFIHCEDKRKVIYNFMTTRESMFMVRETKKMVKRKEKMRAHSRKPNNLQNPAINLSKTVRQTLPNLESDFGVVKRSPYIFNCSIFALDTILSILDITL